MAKSEKFLSGFKEGMKLFGENIALLINSFLLLIVYIFGVGFVFLLAKIFGKKFLETKIESKARTYWKEINLKNKKISDYLKQF